MYIKIQDENTGYKGIILNSYTILQKENAFGIDFIHHGYSRDPLHVNERFSTTDKRDGFLQI